MQEKLDISQSSLQSVMLCKSTEFQNCHPWISSFQNFQPVIWLGGEREMSQGMEYSLKSSGLVLK